MTSSPEYETTIIAAGCFWGIEHKYRSINGVIDTQVGYMGGRVDNPSYSQVCREDTGHAEVVKIIFDPQIITFAQILDVFYTIHDPTQLNRQGVDIGDQYRSAIFAMNDDQYHQATQITQDLNGRGQFSSPIVTQIINANHPTTIPFYPAEEYHQRYIEKNR